MELLKLLSANEILTQVINFLLLLFLLRLFFWKRILKLLDDRKEKIASGFEELENSRQETETLKSEYQTKLNSIEQTTRDKIQEAVIEGRVAAESITKDAQVQAQKIIESARADIKYEIAQAKEELKDRIVDLTINATANLIGERLSEDKDKKLIEDFLEKADKL
ncbi:MAG: F0F1 ATP synthase subunit B [bacterium]